MTIFPTSFLAPNNKMVAPLKLVSILISFEEIPEIIEAELAELKKLKIIKNIKQKILIT
jgi:hypothetical protein